LDNELRSIHFIDEQTGLAAGFGTIQKTTDGGNTWTPTTAKGDFFTSISFPSSSIGYAVGFNGSIIKTTDGGETWDVQRDGNSLLKKQMHFESVRFVSTTTGFVVGRNGIILKTTDGGSNWEEAEHGVTDDLYDIWPVDANRGIIVGEKGGVWKFVG